MRPPRAVTNSLSHDDSLHSWYLDPGIPYDLDMQMTALGAAMMQDNDATQCLVQRLDTAHFSHRSCRTIYSAIASLWRRKGAGCGPECIDAMVVGQLLARQGKMDDRHREYVDATEIAACRDICPGSANIDYYCTQVIENSKLRHLKLLSRAVYTATEAAPEGAAFIVKYSQQALHDIETHGYCDLDKIFAPTK